MAAAKVTDERFIEVWQTSTSGNAAARTLALSAAAVYGRAKVLRKIGVPLKKHAQGIAPRNVAVLTEIAKKFA